MCNLTRVEKINIGVTAVVYPVCSAWPWYNAAKAVAALGLANRVSECVCITFSAIASNCQEELRSIIGPGLSVSNATSFCNDAASSLNVAKSAATTSVVFYSGLGGFMILLGAGLIVKTIYGAYKRGREFSRELE